MNAIFNAIRRLRFRRGPQRLVGGIAGSLALSLNINVWLTRLLMLLSFLLPVFGVVLYAIVWVITPWQDGTIPFERWLQKKPDSP